MGMSIRPWCKHYESGNMISKEQMERVEREFVNASKVEFELARFAELELEAYTFGRRGYDWGMRQRLLAAFHEADYQAEKMAWVLHLIRDSKNRRQSCE